MTPMLVVMFGCGPSVAVGDGSESDSGSHGPTSATQVSDVGPDPTNTGSSTSSADDTSGTTGFPDVPWEGWSIFGESTAPAESIGNIYAGVGDMDGDGLGDFLVGAPTMDGGAVGSGRVYFVRGRTDGEDVYLDDVVAGVGGFAIDGEAAGDGFGFCVAPAGDFNADGFPDAIVGAPFAQDGWGKAYVLYGAPGLAHAALSTLAGDGGGFVIVGETSEEEISGKPGLGGSVDHAQDVDGDTFDDVVLSSPRIGRIYALGGGEALDNGGAETIGDALPGAVVGIGFAGTPSDVAQGLGDHDGDGFGDLLGAKAFYNDVYFGGADWLDPDRKVDYHVNDYISATDEFPTSSAAVGDFTGDGLADLAVGSTWPGGAVHVVHGSPERARADVPGGARDLGRLFTVETAFLEAPPDSTGDQNDWPPDWTPYLPEVMPLGDVDGDGRDDIAVQVYAEEPERWNKIGAPALVGDAVWLVVYGTPEPGILDGEDLATPATAAYGFAVPRPALVSAGCRRSAGDLDADGRREIAFPAPFSEPSGAIDILPSQAR